MATNAERKALELRKKEEEIARRKQKRIHASNPEQVAQCAQRIAKRSKSRAADQQVIQYSFPSKLGKEREIIRVSAEGLGTQPLPISLRDDASLLHDDYLQQLREARLQDAASGTLRGRLRMTGVFARQSAESSRNGDSIFD